MVLTGRATAAYAASLLALGLAACAETTWVKSGADSARRDADLERCEAYARQETNEDFVSRIEETSRGVVAGSDAMHSRDDLRRIDVYDRRESLTEACMRQLGYTAVEGGDDEDIPSAGSEPEAQDDGV